MAQAIMQRYDIAYVVAKILASRGVDVDNAELFLNPKLQNLMPNPSCLKDMDKVAIRLAKAIYEREKIGIIGDYDVDGATSSAVLCKFLDFFGLNPVVHIPDRDEGYGPSNQAFAEFRTQEIRLVVTTDCGTSAFDVLDKAVSEGFDVIVLDHHEAETRLPKVLAVVNPKRLDENNEYPYLKYMAAVGVVFMAVVAINRELKNMGYYINHAAPDLLSLLDLVALGTVCDVVPLLGLNRAFVKQGLKVMSLRQNIGITALSDISKIAQAPSAYHLGFVLGPRINAGGRVGDPSVGNKLLCAKDALEALKLAQKLDSYNIERKDIEAHVLLQAIEMLEGKEQQYPIAFVYGTDWHQGVIGIVAGKLKERYNVPSFVMSIEHDEVKGSARSVNGIDLGALIIAAKEKGLLTKGGGHTMAAGFSLTEEKIEEFKTFVGEYIKEKSGETKITPVINVDALVSLSGANENLAECILQMEPFGASNPEPKIVIENVKISRPAIIGNGHIRCVLADEFSNSLKAIAFRVADSQMGHAMLNADNERFDVVGVLRKDTWQGKTSLQFIIEDIMKA
ncbi:MAG: single-stranded-DNA-specific exonuclease RecJ [Alphaproteobacteria bacterium]|nr:single-stranded-DNA-specific exonuclease RecJ [Alphaproteobacteria bacterium]